jgi:hypothetical protein
MLTPVNFDHNFSLQAGKVQNIVSERMLAAKLAIVELPATKALPKFVLRVGWRVAQPALELRRED